MNRLRLLLIGCLMVCCVQACGMMMGQKKTGISSEARVRHLIGQQLVLKQDMFLHRFSDTGEYSFSFPGSLDEVPISIESYERSPTGWMNDPQYRARYRSSDPSTDHTLGVVRAGTVVEVTKALQVKGNLGTYVDILVRIPDSQWDCDWSIGTLLEDDWGPDASPNLRTHYIDYVEQFPS